MAYTFNRLTAKSGGTSAYFRAYIKIWQDFSNPNNAPYAELEGVLAYASSSSALNNPYLSISLAGSSFSLTGLTWSTPASIGGGKYYTNLTNASSVPTLTLNLSPGDSFTSSFSLRAGSTTMRCYGTVCLPQHVTVTPPATVTLNVPNYFTCTSFTIPNVAGLSAAAYGWLLPSNKSAPLYLDASTQMTGTNGRGNTYSGFYWYPNYTLAQSGDFSGGVGQYKVSASIPVNISWSSTSSGGTGGVYLIAVIFEDVTGTIVYNETPSSAAAPTITLTATEVSGSGLYAQYGKYIKGMSQVRYTAAVTYKFGSVKSYFELVVGYNYTTNSTYTFWPETAGTATAHAEDDHGAETEVSVNYDVYDYWAPTLTAAIHRCRQDGTRDDSGSYCLIEWAINVAPLGNQNSKSLTITHPAGTSTPTLSSYTASGSLIVAADPELSYDIGFSLTDDFTTVTRTMKLSTAGVIMDIYRGGHGIAFGKVAENDYTLEVTSEWDVLLNTSNAKQINLVDALEALATAAGINIYVQQQNNS